MALASKWQFSVSIFPFSARQPVALTVCFSSIFYLLCFLSFITALKKVMSPFLTRHVSTKSCYIFYCPRTKVFSAFSPLLFLFFFLTRCVSPLDLPCAGPHDSFSTDILKGPKLSLPPMPFSFFPLLPFLSFSVLRLLLLDCLSLQCLSGSLERKLGRNEAYVESPQPKGWCLWTTLAASHQTAQVSHMHWWVHPQDCTLMEANSPPEGHDKGGFYVGFFYFPDLSMGGGELHLHPLLVLLLWSDLPVLPAPFSHSYFLAGFGLF